MNFYRISRLVCTAVLSAGILAGCSANLKTATCGWSSNIPRDGSRICTQTYAVLGRIAAAEVTRDDAAIRARVSTVAVAGRMIRFGHVLHKQGVTLLRITPTFELTARAHGSVQVNAYLVGQSKQGKIDDPEVITEHVQRSTVVVTGDLPGEEW